MNEYEITYLADPKLEEAAKNELDEAINKLIDDQSGEISYSSSTDAPGSRRRLHYPIGEQRVCWLRTIQLELDPSKIDKLRTTMRKHKSITRVSVLQTPRREEVSADISETPEAAPAQPTVPDKPKTTAKKVTMEEVEEKIEEALEEEVK